MTNGQRDTSKPLPAPSAAAPVVCAGCTATRDVKSTLNGIPRTPSGWKRHADCYYCSSCWGRAYLLRTIALPIASPLDCTWDELNALLRQAWQLTTSACNWMMTELYARDVRRTGAEEMPPMPSVYLYPELRQRFPDLPSSTVATLERACQRKYRAVRYRVLWTSGAALPNYRYPAPFPVPAQGWQVECQDGVTVISLRLGGQRLRLRLKGGPQFRLQLRLAALIASGEAVPGEAYLRQEGSAILFSMAAWLPRQQPAAVRDRTGVLTVATRRDCLLTASNARKEAIWIYNADHLRRWQAAHARQLQRWSEDHKYEQRPVPAFAARREAAVRKYRHRMESACHEIAAQLAGYASRRRYATVRYDDSERGFCEQFPWFRLRSMIAEKMDAAGIALELAQPAVNQPDEEGQP